MHIHTPLIHLSKAEIIQRGLSLGVDYALEIELSQLFVGGGGEPVRVRRPLNEGTRENPEELKLVRAFRNLKRKDRQVVLWVVATLERAS